MCQISKFPAIHKITLCQLIQVIQVNLQNRDSKIKMQKQPISTQFKFILSTQQTLKNLDELKMSNYERFVKTSEIGKQIQQLAKANLHVQLEELCTKHLFDIPFLKFEIEDAFISSLNLRNFQTSKYFLENGFQLNEHAEDAVINLAYCLEYLMDPKQAPLELLQLVLQYGANPRYCQSMESNTALHFACQSGNLQFSKLLIQYGADMNAVNDNKQTPLGIAIKNKKKSLVEFLKSKNASQHWNQ